MIVSMLPVDIAACVAAEAAHQPVEIYKGDGVWEVHSDGVQVLCSLLGAGVKARIVSPSSATNQVERFLQQHGASANDRQVGGDHYQKPIQPWDYIVSIGAGFLDGNAIKYLSRWRAKGGVEDLKKARHYIDKVIEVETSKGSDV